MSYHMILRDIFFTGLIIFGFSILGTALYGLIKAINKEYK